GAPSDLSRSCAPKRTSAEQSEFPGSRHFVGGANCGARAAYVGKVRDDQIGKLDTHDIRAACVAFGGRPKSSMSRQTETFDANRTWVS
ncbi:MAG: adenosine kinase, partial [Bradyrhizobium sp.]